LWGLRGWKYFPVWSRFKKFNLFKRFKRLFELQIGTKFYPESEDCLGFGVWCLVFGVWGLGFGVWGLGFGVWGWMCISFKNFCKEIRY
jgi:hypothetical protein